MEAWPTLTCLGSLQGLEFPTEHIWKIDLFLKLQGLDGFLCHLLKDVAEGKKRKCQQPMSELLFHGFLHSMKMYMKRLTAQVCLMEDGIKHLVRCIFLVLGCKECEGPGGRDCNGTPVDCTQWTVPKTE